MTEIEELRLIVAAQSKLLVELLAFHRAAKHRDPVALDEDEFEELMDYVCEDLPPATAKVHFEYALKPE